MDRSVLLVGLGGFIGTIFRYYSGVFLSRFFIVSFPYATLSVNVIGCLLIGLAYGAFQKFEGFSDAWWLFFAVGICGGFTTFSAFSLEGLTLLQQEKFLPFLVYVLLSIGLCFGATWLGMVLVKSLF